MAYLTITVTAMTARSNTANITIAMMAETAPDTVTVEVDTVFGIMYRITVLLWLPNMFLTLHVYSKSLASVGISVSSSKESVPLANTVPVMSSHSIVSTAKSVVQLSIAADPYGKGTSCPVILIPKY